MLEQDWKIKVIGFASDASGESKKARADIGRECRYLFVPDCLAHQVCSNSIYALYFLPGIQINLLVSDLLKSNNRMLLDYVDQASELTSWLRSKSKLLAMLRNIRESTNQRGLTVIRPVLTRWSSHYHSLTRLVQLKDAICHLVSSQDKAVVGTDLRSRQKSQEIISLVRSPDFWLSIAK